MVNFKEFFTPERIVTKLGAIKFPQNIFKDDKRTPHYEMDKCMDLYETRPLVNSGIKQMARFICGDKVTVTSADKVTHDFLNKWIKMRRDFDGEVFNMIITGLVTHNVAVEKTWKKMENGLLCLDNIYNCNDVSRIYKNIDYRGNDDEFWLYEVPIEVRTFPFQGEIRTPKFWKVNYVYGSYLFTKMIWAIPIHKAKFGHCKIGWSRDMIYGRSFLASCIDDGEILKEIIKNYSVIARYRAIGRKIFSIGSPEAEATIDDIDKLENDLKNINDSDHIIINKPLKSEPLSYTGENDPMTDEINFLRKEIAGGLVPNFLTSWNDEVNRATAGEIKIPFQLEINSFKTDFIQFLNTTIIDDLRMVYPWIAEDATFSFGHVDLDSKEEKLNWGMQLYQMNVITLNELRKMCDYEVLENGDVFNKDLPTPSDFKPGTVPLSQSVKVKPKGISDKSGATFSEKATANEDDTKWLREMKKDSPIVKRADVKGLILRMTRDDDGFNVYDGKALIKNFEYDEREVANLFFDRTKEKRQEATEMFYDGELPEDKIVEDFYDEVKKLNSEIIDEVFNEIKVSSYKEGVVLGTDMLPKLDSVFKKFNDRIGGVVANAMQRILGMNLGKFSLLGMDVDADAQATKELTAQSDVLKGRVNQQFKTMNEEMKNDIYRHLSDGIVARKSPADIKRELKDTYSNFKVKENPQDYQIDRIVRTELANASVMMKLQKWKTMGFKKVMHITVLDNATGDKDKSFNRKPFEIDYLLMNKEDRIPLHPNCRCQYVAYE